MNPLQCPFDNDPVPSPSLRSFHGSFRVDGDRTRIQSDEDELQKLDPPMRSSSLRHADITEKSQASPLSSSIQQPKLVGVNTTDVLCGRDRVSHAHVGNKQFRKLIEKLHQTYQSATSRDVKTQITCQIIATVHRNGGRFLKINESTGRWEVVTDHYAREKVSHALRSAKDPRRPKIKKRRQMKEYVPTPEEEALFQDALADQQQIFQSMIGRYQHSQEVHLEHPTGDQTPQPHDGDDQHDADIDADELSAEIELHDFDFYH